MVWEEQAGVNTQKGKNELNIPGQERNTVAQWRLTMSKGAAIVFD